MRKISKSTLLTIGVTGAVAGALGLALGIYVGFKRGMPFMLITQA